ncbi:hypothetical protein [Adlercreutzia muris]|uniref:Uncharacterized protein n=1 Tax=Adlercreutzia muris TaxID=1796610 RepID=A0A7C8FLD6_9ACTN|nr:hypothetical protein [Adlercreutzia muris]KAB1647978.1 hypothetical protein F8D48_06710 [Adlercreutzia muris]MCR2027730.1 hypothetical protein [Adlercreutzia muris]
MNVHIIMTDDYSPKPTVAFLDRAEAEAAAASIHGLSQERISSRICEVPLLAFARMPTAATEGGCEGRSDADAATD